MSFRVVCPDGVDRVDARWPTLREAEQDALYFSVHGNCFTWTEVPGDYSCPGGDHYAVSDDLNFCAGDAA